MYSVAGCAEFQDHRCFFFRRSHVSCVRYADSYTSLLFLRVHFSVYGNARVFVAVLVERKEKKMIGTSVEGYLLLFTGVTRAPAVE